MRIYFLFSIFLLSPVSFAETSSVVKDSSFTQGSYRTPPPVYKCQLDEECLDHLNHVLLDKEVDRGIYQYCQITYEEIKNCCINPSECQEDWAEGATQDLKDSSLSLVKTGEGALSCELNRLSHLTDSLSGFQAEMCEKGLNNCKVDCENKLREVRQTFRECFLIPEDSTIEEILKKAETPPTGEEACYKKMKESAEKYKSQSLNENASLREDLKAKDIVQCEDIQKEKTRASLNDFALNICQIAKDQEEENRQAEEAKIQAEEERRQAEEAKRQEEENKRIEEAKREESARQNLAKSAEGDSGSQPRNQQDEGKTANSVPAKTGGTNTNKSAQNQSSSEAVKNQASSSKASALLGAGALAGATLGAKALKEGKSSQTGDYLTNSFLGKETDEIISQDLNLLSIAPEPKGLFKKTWSKIKNIFKKSVDTVKNIIPFLDSEKETIEKMEQLCEIKKNLFFLRQVVYQSVKAPQIERLDEEDESPFDDYDLIAGKPAGVIVRIRKTRSIRRKGLQEGALKFNADKLIDKFQFSLVLKINGKLYPHLLCSENLKKEVVEYNVIPGQGSVLTGEQEDFTVENSHCNFSWQDIGESYIYKFISLPMQLSEALIRKQDEGVKIEILTQLKLKESIDNKMATACESSEKFTVNILEPKSFKVLFTGMHTPFCNGNSEETYKSTANKDIEDYFNSREVQEDFYDMFPVSREEPYKPEIKMLLTLTNLPILQFGSCKKGSSGIALDFLNLSEMSSVYGADIIFAVVNKEYLDYRGVDSDTVGKATTQFPKRYIWTPIGDLFFSHETRKGVGLLLAGRSEEGTFLHELGHILGQKKEHYEDENPFYCSQFTKKGELPREEHRFFSKNKIVGDSCYHYKVTGGMVREPSFQIYFSQHWKLLNNQSSIMHNKLTLIKDDTYKQWIDRETYQKAMMTLRNNLIVPEDLINRIKGQQIYQEPKIIQIRQKLNDITSCDLKKRPVIKVSGIYRKNEKNRLLDFSVKAQTLEVKKNPFSSGNFSITQKREENDHIIIQLKKQGRLEEEVVFPRKTYIETFYNNKPAKKEEMDVFPIFASFFPACHSLFKKDEYTISVKEVYNENGLKKENILIKSVPAPWKEEIEL